MKATAFTLRKHLGSFVALPVLAAGLVFGADPPQRAADEGPEARPVPLRQQEAQTPPGALAWERRLTDPDLDRRLLAYGEAVREARRNPQALEQIERWAKSPDDGELAWTARLLLREVGQGAARSRPFGPGPLRGPRADRLRQFGEDIFDDLHERWLDDHPGLSLRDLHRQLSEPFADLEGRLREHFGGPLAELEERMRELERSLSRGFGQRDFGAAPRPPRPPAPGRSAPGAQVSGRSVQVEIQPDGVRVKISETRDGKEHTREYRADSIEDLLDEHPELADTLGAFSTRSRWPDPLRALSEPPLLGIQYAPVTPERAREVDLEPGVGLEVLAVVAGSLAERLGLVPGDILVELEGLPLTGPEDVRAVLSRRAPETGLEGRALNADGIPREIRIDPPTRLERTLRGVETRQL